MVNISAPGKVHFIGEHAVVYGEPAIIAAVGKRFHVTAQKSDEIEIVNNDFNESRSFGINEIISFADCAKDMWNECYDKRNFSELFRFMKNDRFNPVKAAIGKTLDILNINFGVSLQLKSEIPIGAGLGSSAAMAVSVVKAISYVYNEKLTQTGINDIAFEIEKFNHGMPSGGDNSTCCFGGLVWFQKDTSNDIVSLRNEIPYKLENFVLVYSTKPKKTTGELVQSVRNLDETYRNPRIKEIGLLTKAMKEALKNRDFKTMKEIINADQKNLKELGVSTPEIDDITLAVARIGGAAKLCGGGGGGIVLCYHERKDRLLKTIIDLGYVPVEVDLAVDGVRIDSI